MRSLDADFEQLDDLLSKTGTEGRVRLATYLRRYISPTVALDLLRNGQLELLTRQREVELVTVFFVDIRDFVRTVRQIESEGAGLLRAAQILEDFFSTAVDIIFEYEGMVGEFAGDRIMAVFGVPIPRHDDAQRAVKAAIKIQREVAKLQNKWQDEWFMRLPGFNVGIGINTGGKVWVGDVGSSWRRELMAVGSTTNIAARVEELTKEQRYKKIDGLNILATEATIKRTKDIIYYKKVGSKKLRGIDRPLSLYKIKGLKPGVSLIDTDQEKLHEDRELISLIAERVESAIEIAKLIKVKDTFATIGQMIITPSLDLDHVLHEVLQATSMLVGAKKASIGLVNEKTNLIEFKAALVQEELDELKKHPLKIGQGIIGQVIKSGEPIKEDDASRSKTFYPGMDKATGLSTRSVLCVPLMIGPKTIGAIEVMDQEANKFSDEELMLLQSIAAFTAIFIENARLHESIVSRANSLKKIADALTSSIFDLEELFRTIMDGLKEMLDPQIGSIMLVEKDELKAKATIIPGDLEKMEPIKIGQGIAGWVAKHSEPVLIEDAQKDRRFYSGIDERTGYTTRSVLCVPMKVGPKVIGVIQILDQSPNRFRPEDIDILSSIAASASVAFENSEQYKRRVDAEKRRVDAEKIVAMSEMASDFVHRINNKVGFIRTTARRIERRLQEGRLSDEFLTQKLRDIFCSAEDTIEIAKRIREPFQPIKGEPVDANDCLSRALRDSRIPESIEVDISTTPLPPITATQQLKEVFENLIRNAVEAMENKGTLRVSSELKEGWVVISVEDTGPGIPKQNQDKIFHLGFTTKEDSLGYGLWRSQTYVKKLGGSLYFEPDRLSGCKFVVELPVAN